MAADGSEWDDIAKWVAAADADEQGLLDEQGEAPEFTAEELAFAEAYWDEIDQLNRELASGSTRSRGGSGVGSSDSGGSSGGSHGEVHDHQPDEL